jgi:tetratricopeptide (TPR) repeat protein
MGRLKGEVTFDPGYVSILWHAVEKNRPTVHLRAPFKTHTKPRWVFVLIAASILGIATAQENDMQHMDMSAPMGTVHFENSCSSAVQTEFDHGVAALYSFWFTDARKHFETAAALDPGCSIAFWGEAMSNYEQISGSGLPEGQQLQSGLEAIDKANSAHKRTAREQAYIDAIAIIFAADAIPDHDTRVRRYSAAMGAIAADYPSDTQAKVLYAMSLLKNGMPSDPDMILAHQALTILNGVLKVEPDNPGVLHSIIHAADNPQMASLGLDAARSYAKIASAAPHALHMPSHIFARLGDWNEDIESNLVSKAAAEQPALLHSVAENRLHAMDFLEYAYLQIGQDDRAAAIAHEAAEIRPTDFSTGLDRYYYIMESDFPTHLVLETGDWVAAISLQPMTGADNQARQRIYWAQAVAAGHLKDQKAAAQAEARVRAAFKPDELASVEAHPSSLWAEVKAWTLFSAGETDKAVALLKPIADMQDQIGKGETELPAREMIGDMLRIAGRNSEALSEYRQSLKTDPGRFNTLIHAGEVAEQLGIRQEAAEYYRLLLHNADNPSPRVQKLLSGPRAFLSSASNAGPAQ